MTEQTDAAEVDVRATLLAALNDEYGDQGWDELRSLSRIVRIIAAREAAAEARGAQAVLDAVEEALRLVDPFGPPRTRRERRVISAARAAAAGGAR